MEQAERRSYLIKHLMTERPELTGYPVPCDMEEQKQLLRGLFNLRMPGKIGEDFLSIQNEYLKEETKQKGVTDASDLQPLEPGIYLWKGDITTLRCDAIVNAANSGLTGCYVPCHGCIDNCIHTYAGIQLRNACAEIMKKQGYAEPAGKAKMKAGTRLVQGMRGS